MNKRTQIDPDGDTDIPKMGAWMLMYEEKPAKWEHLLTDDFESTLQQCQAEGFEFYLESLDSVILRRHLHGFINVEVEHRHFLRDGDTWRIAR